MKKALMTCAVVLGLSGFATAQEPNAEADEIRAEIIELTNLLQTITSRIEHLERRLMAMDSRQDLLPWQKQQPYLWDGIQRERRKIEFPDRPLKRF